MRQVAQLVIIFRESSRLSEMMNDWLDMIIGDRSIGKLLDPSCSASLSSSLGGGGPVDGLMSHEPMMHVERIIDVMIG